MSPATLQTSSLIWAMRQPLNLSADLISGLFYRVGAGFEADRLDLGFKKVESAKIEVTIREHFRRLGL